MSGAPRIGVSLALEYLAGARDAPELAWYGPVDVILRNLAEAGATSIELREIRPDSEIDAVRGALDRLRDAGMAATIHGVLPPWESGDDWHRCVPALVAALEWLRDHEAPPAVVTVHAYVAVNGTPQPLGRRSAARLAQMARWSELEAMQAVFAVELNRAKASVDPCITYDGVLDVLRQAGHPRVGSCFDFGHAWSNVLGGLLPAAPPVAYLASVMHTHIHDVGPTGRTHWPLTESRLSV